MLKGRRDLLHSSSWPVLIKHSLIRLGIIPSISCFLEYYCASLTILTPTMLEKSPYSAGVSLDCFVPLTKF